MVVGDREVAGIEHFSPLKKSRCSGSAPGSCAAPPTRRVPDTTSGFRAYNREAALALQVVSKFTYTLETIIQAGKMTVAIDHVPIRTNEKLRESRLFPSMWTYVRRNARLDLPHLRDVRAAAGVHDRRACSSACPPLFCGAAGCTSAYFGQGDGAATCSRLIVGDVLFIAVAAGRARHHRRPALGPADHDPAHLRARAPDRARARRPALALRAGRARRPARHPRPARPRPAPRAHRGARGAEAYEHHGHARRRGHGHRQHLRQVRLDQPGRASG